MFVHGSRDVLSLFADGGVFALGYLTVSQRLD
jgi:hypothetical protein